MRLVFSLLQIANLYLLLTELGAYQYIPRNPVPRPPSPPPSPPLPPSPPPVPRSPSTPPNLQLPENQHDEFGVATGITLHANRYIGHWCTSPPSPLIPRLLHVSVFPLRDNEVPNAEERDRREIHNFLGTACGRIYSIYVKLEPVIRVVGASLRRVN